VARNLVFALRLRRNIPAVVSVVNETDVVGQQVQLRAMGALDTAATAHNVIGVLRPPVGSSQYVLLTAHLDGWYQAAADNGGGAAAVLRAAELLARNRPGIGVVAALFDGEEVGLLGSQAFAAKLAGTGPGFDVGDGGAVLHMADLKADLNLDASSARASDVQDRVRSVAGTDAPLFSWRAMVFSEEPVLAQAFLSTFAAHQVLGLPLTARAATEANGGITRTDARWFHEGGVPVAWPVAGYPEYHTDGDVPSAMDLADLENVASAAADLAGQVATLPIGPVPPQAR
jgi:Zn-dependent M28 family amino/carboxypeptidase